MVITRIELRRFRNYGQTVLYPHESVNIFFGQNGSGKTNLLEAIHYCALGKSHRVNQDMNAVQIGEKNASCNLLIQGKYARNEIEIRLQPGEDTVKSVWIDQKRVSRLSEMMGVLRCVIFSPEDLNLIREGPSVRRKYLDMMISQMNQGYFIALQKYKIAMSQRNAILKQIRNSSFDSDQVMDEFEAVMAEYGKLICEERIRIIRLLAERGNQVYRNISGSETEIFAVQYQPSVKVQEDGSFPMKKQLQDSREEDIRMGITTIGPHRDDLVLTLNQKNMKSYASQGQMRTAALSLKLAQMMIIQELTGDQPVLLLDDVMSELDLKRRMNLLGMLNRIQTFITCSDEGDLAPWQNHRTYQVSSIQGKGTITEMKAGEVMEKHIFQEPDFD